MVLFAAVTPSNTPTSHFIISLPKAVMVCVLQDQVKGVVICRLWVNDKEAESSIQDYVDWWLEDSYDETVAGSVPEIIPDRGNPDPPEISILLTLTHRARHMFGLPVTVRAATLSIE